MNWIEFYDIDEKKMNTKQKCDKTIIQLRENMVKMFSRWYMIHSRTFYYLIFFCK